MSTVVRLPRGLTPRRAPIDYDGHSEDVVLDAAQDWSNCRTLPMEHRKIFRDLAAGIPVEASALNNAVIAALAANATRYGQSMDRRRGYAPLLAVSRWLAEQAGGQVPAREIVRTVEVAVPAVETRVERVEVPVNDPAAEARLAFVQRILTQEQRDLLAAFGQGYATGKIHGAA